MHFEEFARDSGKALADAASRLPTPSLTEISSRRRRATLAAGAVGVAAILVASAALAAAIAVKDPVVPPAADGSTVSTMQPEEAQMITVVDLLDGSRLE